MVQRILITQNAKVSIQFSSFSFGPTPTVLSATQAESPANLILTGDGQPFAYGSPSNFTGNLNEPYYACLAYQALANKTTLFASYKPYVRYNGTANYAYSDGHAKATQPEKTLSPNNQWYPEYPLATDQIANPQGGGFYAAPAAGTGGLTPTTNCAAFQFWNGR